MAKNVYQGPGTMIPTQGRASRTSRLPLVSPTSAPPTSSGSAGGKKGSAPLVTPSKDRVNGPLGE